MYCSCVRIHVVIVFKKEMMMRSPLWLVWHSPLWGGYLDFFLMRIKMSSLREHKKKGGIAGLSNSHISSVV